MATIDNLTLEITANTNRAVDNLTKLSEALSALKSASKGISSTNLQKVADAFGSVKIAVSGISLSSIRRVERLADALNRVASVDASNLSRVSNAIARMKNIPTPSAKPSTPQATSQLPALVQPTTSSAPAQVKNLPAVVPPAVQTGLSAIAQEEKEFYGSYREIVDNVEQSNLGGKVAENTKTASNAFSDLASSVKKVSLQVLTNEFKSFGSVIQRITKPLTTFIKALGRIALYRAIRGILKSITQGIREGIQNLALYSKAMNELDSAKANHTMSELATAFLYLKNSVATALMPIIQALVPAIKHVVEVAVQALNIINQVISVLQGKSTFTKAKVYWVDYADSLDKTTGSAKKLHKQLAGFDELNNLTTSAGSGASSALDPTQMFEEAEIDSKVLDSVEKIKKIFEEIKDLIPVIGAGILAWTIGSKLANALTTLGLLSKAGGLRLALGLTLMGVGFTLEGMSIADIIMNGLNIENFGKSVGGALLASLGSFLTGSAFATIFGASFLTGIIGGLGTAVAGIGLAVAGIWDSVVNGIDWLSAILTGIGTTLAGGGIGAIVGAIIGALGGPIGAGMGALIGAGVGLVIGAITDLTILIVQNWDSIWATAKNIWGKIKDFVVGVFTNMKEKIPVIIETLKTKIKELPAEIAYTLGFIVGQTIAHVQNIGNWLKTNVPILIENFMIFVKSLPDRIKEIGTKIIDYIKTLPAKVKEQLTKIKDKFIEWKEATISWITTEVPKIINSIVDWFAKLPEAMVTIGSNMIKGLWNGILSVGNWLWDCVKNFFGTAWETIKGAFEGFGSGVQAGYDSVPHYAKGGYVGGDLFIANERGAEMVGSVNGRTAVANNDQITDAIAQATYRAMSEALQENSMNITIVGDADGMFKVMRNKSRDYRRETGRSAFA